MIRDSLDDEDSWVFNRFQEAASHKEKFKEIKTALLKNQKEHSHF